MLNEPPDKNPSENAGQLTLRIPTVTPAFTAVMLVLLFLLTLVRIPTGPDEDTLLRLFAVSGDGALMNGQSYRALTSLFLLEQPYATSAASIITGIIALVINLYSFYIIGTSAERLWGHLRFGLVYFLGGMAGTLTTLIFVGAGAIPQAALIVGAPAAIMATLSGEIIYMYRHRKLYGQRGQQRRGFIGTLVLLNMVVGAFASRTDLFGLLGALIGGAVLAWYISPVHLPRPHPEDAGALLGEDVNPLKRRLLPLAVYGTGLVALLALASVLFR
ncbi:MAG: rhomboid family intramembrane serine protease [Chloroflexota bacterium]